MKKFAILLFTLILSASAFAQINGKISGKVTYGNNNLSLHDASVQIVQLKRSVKTDDDGKYEITDIPPGRYTILVHLEGFSDISKVIVMSQNANAVVDFQLSLVSLKEQVTVTASGKTESVFDSFNSVNSVGSTRITEKAATAIGEVLDGETGVAKRSFGAGSSRPVIRGFDGDRVLVTQDGIRSGSVGSQSGDHGEPLDVLSLERIEVVKGPATLLYGSNAIGGVVNAISNDETTSHDGFRGSFSTIGGTNNKQGAVSGGLEYGVKNWLFRGNGTFQREGDYRSPIGRIPNSNSRASNFGGKIGYYADKGFFSTNFSYDKRRYGIPFAALFEAEEEEEERLFGILPEAPDEDIDIKMRNFNYRLNAGFRNFDSFITGGNFSVNYTRYRHQELEIFGNDEEIGTTYRNKTINYRGVFEQKTKENWSGRFGFEGFNRDYSVTGAEALITGEKVKHFSNSVFALQELSYKRVSFQFGGRIEDNRYKPASPELVERKFTGFSGALGMKVGLWNGGNFVVNYTNSYRSPALEELYNNGPHIGTITFEIGDQNLRRERTNGIDVSLRHISDKFSITGDVYYYDINKFIFLSYIDEDDDGEIDIEDGLPVATFSQADSRFIGAELSADYSINKYVGVFFNGDLVRAKLKTGNINLPRIPPARGRFGLDFRYKGLSLRPEAVFANEQTKIFPLETRTAGYSIFNIAGSYTIGRQHYAHIFTFNAYNLGDKLYRNHLSFIKNLAPEMGRGIRFGYTFRFF
ncbi:MAG: TonB-dependent receptor [Pyrinomonadaceae bacterium]|nr:TonB-dependent receptor [Pyrinomonadaceae bacterium]